MRIYDTHTFLAINQPKAKFTTHHNLGFSFTLECFNHLRSFLKLITRMTRFAKTAVAIVNNRKLHLFAALFNPFDLNDSQIFLGDFGSEWHVN